MFAGTVQSIVASKPKDDPGQHPSTVSASQPGFQGVGSGNSEFQVPARLPRTSNENVRAAPTIREEAG
jgi:hypothetical protein